jgi:hypothetical protein
MDKEWEKRLHRLGVKWTILLILTLLLTI